MIDHDTDMLVPLEVIRDKNPEVLQRGDGGDAVRLGIVSVLGTPDLPSGEIRLL